MIGLRFLPPDSTDVCGAGTRKEPLRTSARVAIDYLTFFESIKVKQLFVERRKQRNVSQNNLPWKIYAKLCPYMNIKYIYLVLCGFKSPE